MSAEQSLLNACAEWRRLAEAEGRAIRLRNWDLVLECQQVLKNFQPVINDLTLAARAERKRTGGNGAAKEGTFQAAIGELMALGKRNNSLLQAAREAARSRHEQLEQTARNLRRLQHSYVLARPAAWTSFS